LTYKSGYTVTWDGVNGEEEEEDVTAKSQVNETFPKPKRMHNIQHSHLPKAIHDPSSK